MGWVGFRKGGKEVWMGVWCGHGHVMTDYTDDEDDDDDDERPKRTNESNRQLQQRPKATKKKK